MNRVDLVFQVNGHDPLPADHGYALYGTVSRTLPEVHAQNGIGIHPIRGRQIGNRQMMLTDTSRLVLRTPDDRIGELIALSGKQLDVAGAKLRVGVPQVRPLIPAPMLRSRLVIIKVAHTGAADLTEESFTAAARKQLDTLGISPEAVITIPRRLDNTGNEIPLRRTLRIKQKEIVGYEVIVEHLTAEESLTLQQHGLGGRRHMGCGVFAPTKWTGAGT